MAVVLVAVVWLGARGTFWLGWANGDDICYGSYAWHFDRSPSDHREFRVLPELAMRGSMKLLGPTEVAAALPSLASSLALAIGVAWLIGWPRRLDGGRTAAMLIGVTVPLDVVMASYPGAPAIAAGLAALGSAGLLRGGRNGRIAGAVLLGLAVACHEVTVFWLGALGAATALSDRERWRQIRLPLLAALVVPLALEAAVWAALLGDPLARLSTSAAETARTSTPRFRFGGSWSRFFLWPMRVLVVSHQLGIDLLALVTVAVAWWHRLERWQRALLLTAGLYFLWLGYGTQVPWAYRPRSRAFHYYIVLALPIGAVLGPALSRHLRPRAARAAVATIVTIHLAGLAVGGRWGSNVDVSRALLAYATANPQQTLLADAHTLEEMVALNGFEKPANVVGLAGDHVYRGVLPSRLPCWRRSGPWPETAVDAVLINHERRVALKDRAFREFLAEAERGEILWRLGPRLKPFLRPVASVIGVREWMVLYDGAEVVELPTRPLNVPAPGLEQRRPG